MGNDLADPANFLDEEEISDCRKIHQYEGKETAKGNQSTDDINISPNKSGGDGCKENDIIGRYMGLGIFINQKIS